MQADAGKLEAEAAECLEQLRKIRDEAEGLALRRAELQSQLATVEVNLWRIRDDAKAVLNTVPFAAHFVTEQCATTPGELSHERFPGLIFYQLVSNGDKTLLSTFWTSRDVYDAQAGALLDVFCMKEAARQPVFAGLLRKADKPSAGRLHNAKTWIQNHLLASSVVLTVLAGVISNSRELRDTIAPWIFAADIAQIPQVATDMKTNSRTALTLEVQNRSSFAEKLVVEKITVTDTDNNSQSVKGLRVSPIAKQHFISANQGTALDLTVTADSPGEYTVTVHGHAEAMLTGARCNIEITHKVRVWDRLVAIRAAKLATASQQHGSEPIRVKSRGKRCEVLWRVRCGEKITGIDFLAELNQHPKITIYGASNQSESLGQSQPATKKGQESVTFQWYDWSQYDSFTEKNVYVKLRTSDQSSLSVDQWSEVASALKVTIAPRRIKEARE